jgi:L,D-transpeptidase catalytic domain
VARSSNSFVLHRVLSWFISSSAVAATFGLLCLACQYTPADGPDTTMPSVAAQPSNTLVSSTPTPAPLKLPLVAPRIVISKSARRLELYANGHIVRTYRIALGLNPTDNKERQGDRRTPEGDFYICMKNDRSQFYLSLGLSYPNEEAAERGLRDGLITQAQHDAIVSAIQHKQRPPWNTQLGGEVMLHGGGTTAGDWTWGCIALADADIKELFDAIPNGTPVRIEH